MYGRFDIGLKLLSSSGSAVGYIPRELFKEIL